MNKENIIPKKIHYVWLGPNQLPNEYAENIQSWKQHCPDYEIIEWNEKNFDINNACDYVKQAYEAKRFAFVSDYIRLYALYTHGGIYLDTDVLMKKNFDIFLTNKLFIGKENDAYLGTCVIGSVPFNKDIKYLLDSYNSRQFINSDKSYDTTANVQCITFYLYQKYHFPIGKTNFSNENIAIFSREYFSPKDYFSGKLMSTKNSYAIHNFHGGWSVDNSKKKKVAKILLKLLPAKISMMLFNSYKRRQFKKKIKILNGKKNEKI